MTPKEIHQANKQLADVYRACFNSPAGKIVLHDLMKFCAFRTDCENQVDEGKRRAFLRIVQMMNLTEEHLLALYAGRSMGDDNE